MPIPQHILDEANRVAQEAARVAGLGTYTPGVGLTPLPAAPVAAPAAPVVDPNVARVQAAAKAGVGVGDLGAFLPQQNQNGIRDELAKRYGYGDFNDFSQQVFKPSQTTAELYKKAYKSAGLESILASIKSKKDQLNQQAATVSENPWLSEASRSGKLRILNDLASADIANDVELYNARLSEVNGLVDRSAADLAQDAATRQAQFNFLLAETEKEAEQRQQTALSQYLPDYLSSRPKDVPKTIESGGAVYQWDDETNTFKKIIDAPAPEAPDGFTLSEGESRVEYNPDTKQWEVVASGPPKAPATPAKKAPTQSQYTAAGFASRMTQAEQVLNSPDILNYINGLNRAEFALQKSLPEIAQSDKYKQWMQAARSLITAQLRKESGAAISAGEFAEAYKTYLPAPGDSATLREQKAKTRATLINSMRREAGGAYEYGNLKEYYDANPMLQPMIERVKSENPNLTDEEVIQIMEEDSGGFSAAGGGDDQASRKAVAVTIPKSSRLAYVNNNPGNLRFAGQAGAMKGEKGFARFDSPGAGLAALDRQIALDASRGLTLAGFVNKYAPPTENDTGTYLRQIASATGATASTPLTSVDRLKLIQAVARKESGTQLTFA